MPVFVSSTSAATRPGVYAIEQAPPSVIAPTGSATAALIDQLPWGPSQSLYTTSSFRDFIDTFAPAGFSHTGSGYLAAIKKAFPVFKVVRVLDPVGQAKATCAINKTGPTLMLTLTAKYYGVSGNSLTATISAASDGNANHFNLAVTVTGATGTTTDLIQNLNYSGVGADSNPDLSQALLIGSIVKNSAGTPIVGTTSFTGGLDGTITAAHYVGTQGAPDNGVSLCENDNLIDAVFTGDPGNSFRAVVNAGLQAHADFKTDRVAYIAGNSGQTAAAAQADVASYRSLRTVYVDPWCKISDDTTGATQLVPAAPFAASVACRLAPSTDIGWRDPKVIAMLSGVLDVEIDRGGSAAANTAAGITTLIKQDGGGFAFESGVVTYAPLDPSRKLLTRTRMGHYIARSETASLKSRVNAPNVAFNWQDEVNAVQTFLNQLVANGQTDPNNQPFIVAGKVTGLAAANSTASIAAGNFFIPQSIQTAASQAFIFLQLTYGPTVNVAAAL
jgi:phage tail sheath protein FI